jgi:hypothetical protein
VRANIAAALLVCTTEPTPSGPQLGLVHCEPQDPFFLNGAFPFLGCLTNEALESTITAAFAMYRTLKLEEEHLQEILPFAEEIGKMEMPREPTYLLYHVGNNPLKPSFASSVLASVEYQSLFFLPVSPKIAN